MKHFIPKFLFAFVLFCWSFFSYGQTNPNRYLIQNTNGAITPTALTETGFSKVARVKQATNETFKGKYFRIIQFYEIPTEELRKSWEKQGLTLTNYLSGNAYYAVINNNFDLSLAKAQIRAILPVNKMFKKETSLYTRVASINKAVSIEKTKLIVTYYKGLNANEVIDSLKKLGVEIQNHRAYSQQLDITIPESMVEQISSLSFIQYIGEAPGEPVNESYNHRNSSGRTNYLNTNFNGVNYNGAGVVIGIGEGLIADNPIDVKGRFTEFVTGSEISNHKIGVIQNAAGAGTLDPTNRNNAWGATVLSLPVAPDYVELFNTNHLLFTNHSYGSNPPIVGAYNLEAQDLDNLINTNPLTMVIFSAGNSGTEAGFYSPYSGIANWANITAPSKHNKNQLAIGALNANDELTSFSSRGPMYDGRIIPQLVVEGIEGTSDAAPKVTGMLAVLEQIYKSKNSNNEAPSSLLRAVLMNTADDLENPGPDFKTGYGRPNMRRAYNVINNTQYLTSTISNGSTNSHSISVPAGTKQVRVMIVWPDVPATLNATTAIVNDLDLVGTDPSNTSYLPWVLNSSADAASISADATREADHLNTIEQITVNNPTTGNWNFNVTGYNVPQGSQTYYLVYEFLQDELVMAYPLQNERFESGQTYYLRWDSYGTSGTFDLSYELDGSGTWNSITTGIDATKRVYEWVAPNVTGIHSVKFKVTKGGTATATSDVNYIGAVPQNLSVQLAAGSTVNLYWTAVPGATGYKVYRLGANYMEEVTTGITFNGASATLTNQSTSADEYYAVSAITGTNEGQRTMALKKSPGDIVADPLTFTAAATSSSQINLSWTKNVINSDVMVAWSSTPIFGTPINGQNYTEGSLIDGGGTVLYNGGDISTLHVSLTPYTTYYYKIWSKTSGDTYSTGITTYETTDCETASTLPFQEDFTDVTTLPSCWKLRDNQGNGENWQFGTTSAGTYTPTLTGNYAYINSYSSSNNLRNADLISPTLDLTNNSNIILSFKHHFISTSSSTATVSYSIDNGANWTVLQTFGYTPNPSTYSSGVITELEGKSQVKFKWTYTSTAWTFYWAIDDINIYDSSSNWTGDIDSDWFKPGNWSTGEIPTATSAVVIPSDPTNQPQINAAGAVCGDITIKSGASLTMNASTAYTLSVSGDWTNNGLFNAGASTVDFKGTNALQTIAGNSTTTFNILSVTKGAQDKILEATGQIATTTSVQITSGTFELNNTTSIVNLVSGLSISSTKGVWLNAGTMNLLGTTYVWGGDLRISGGLLNSGLQKIYYNGGNITIEGGQVNASAIRPYTTNTSTGTYNQSGGVVTITASSSDASRASFDITSGSAFIMSGGTICIQKANTSFASDFQNIASTYNVTGGTLQIGDASTPVNQTIRINSTVPIYNLMVNSANAPTSQLVSNGLTVNNDVTIGTNAKIDVNSLNLSVGGNWTNNGDGLGTTPTGTVLLNGTNAQSLGGTSNTVFDNLTENNANGLGLDNDATVNGTLTLTSGVISSGNNKLIIPSSGNVVRTSGHVNGYLQKEIVTGTVDKTFEVGDVTEAAYKPVSVSFNNVTTAGDLTGSTTNAEQPQIGSSELDPAASINRYWTLTNSGIAFDNYSATFNFSSNDIDAGASVSNMIAGKYSNSSTWEYPTISSRTSSSISLSGLTSFSDFAFAKKNIGTNINEKDGFGYLVIYQCK